ncbi:MAG: cation transporter [candidate division Zixibacteria bacterium]|nr:cation transporter [candidate division Zixibacteria bacterium]
MSGHNHSHSGMSGHSHGHTHHHSHGTGSKKLGFTIILNLIITAAEFVGGILSGSLALLSDAAHNLADVIALILAYLGAKGSEMKPTKRSTYGFKRLEVVTALINSLTLVVISVYIIIEAFERYSEPQPIDAPIMLIVAVIGLLGNVFSVWILHRDRNDTINNKAAFLHMMYDAVSSVAVIIGGIIIMFTDWYLVDLILSIVISVMILWSGFDILKVVFGIFMEAAPKDIDIDKVKESVEKLPGVREMHHIHIWSISSSQIALSCHVVLDDPDCTGFTAVIRDIHELLRDKFNITHGTVQPEGNLCPEVPVVTDLVKKDRKQ